MSAFNVLDLPITLKTLFPEGSIADVWQDYTSDNWVVGDYHNDEVLLGVVFEKLEDIENLLLQNNIAYRIH